ncbi:MAG: response regulator transcription factor [Anaerolineales bacterium]|nr:response regulator transcription factor [Anaerolineales bacterium]
MSDKIRILLADDHDLVLDGLQLRIRDMDDMRVVGAVNDGEALLAKLDTLDCDVVVLDLHMGGSDGFEVLQRIRDKAIPVRILVLTASVDGFALQRALELGADGIAMKTDPPRQTMEAIRQVAQGNVVYPQAIHNWLMRRARRSAENDPQALTAREEEVMALVAQGLTNQEIAQRLTVSENTVKYHIQNIYGKLNVNNRTEATRLYLERG